MNEWIHEWMNEWMHEWMNEWLNEWVNEWMNEWVNEWMNEWLNEWMNEWNRTTDWLTEWMNRMTDWLSDWLTEWMNEWVSDWMIEWLNDWMIEWLIEWMNEWMDGWMDGRMNEWINHWINSSINHSIVRPHLPKVLWNPRFLTFLCEIGLSLQSRARFALRTRPHKKGRCEHVSFFLRFLCEIELSLKSRAHFGGLIFRKCSQSDSFLTIFIWNRSLATVSCACCQPHLPKELRTWQFFKCKSSLCAFCRQLFKIEVRTRGNKDPTSATMVTRKNRGFALENLFKPKFTRSRTVTLLHFRWWCGWHDDVVDIIYNIYYVVAMIGALYYTHYLYLCGLFRILEMICFIRLITPDMIMDKWTKWSYQ